MSANSGPPSPRLADAPAGRARDVRSAGASADAGPVTLAVRLDEGAAEIHRVIPAKMAVTLMGGLMAALLLPIEVCVVWIAIAAILCAGSWVSTRAQSRGEAVNRPQRIAFAACLAAENLLWVVLGLILWNTGSVNGQATAAVILTALGFLAVLLFYNTPAVFLAAGASPAMAALTVIALRGALGWRQMLPVWLGLGLSIAFNLGRALDTPSSQQAKRRLNDSLNQYKILAENVTDVIMRTDLDGRHQYVSPASLAVLGYRPEELVGTLRQNFLEPDDAAMMDVILERMLAAPERTEVVTLRVRHKLGHPLQTHARLVFEGGVPVAVIGVSRNVSERLAADIALIEAKVEAEAATRAKGEFLANVSHEIRTPMNGVLGALHLLESEPISAEGRRLLREAHDCGRMLSQLVNDILDFSKIEAGQIDLAPEPMDIGQALETVTALLEGQARAKGVKLLCEIAGDDLWIEADPVRLRQTMFNLVGNAVKFTQVGHVTARLAVSDAADGRRHVRFEVEDTGIGISLEAQSRLFERFRQAEGDTARRFGGTGLGLAISQGLARGMGGEIRFTSTEGQGSTFWLEFDAARARPVSLEATEQGLLDGVNILLVEDNPTNRLVARTMLTRLGATVDEAEDGVAGLEAARAGAHDLILMDVQMPHMNGVDATRAIRGLRGPAAQTPIIGLTANVMVHQRADYIAAGMNGVVAKPISPAALLAEIARLLEAEDGRLAS